MYVPESELSLRDCSECAINYRERPCPVFQERFLKILCREFQIELHQMRYLVHKLRLG